MELQPGGFEPNPKHEQNICFLSVFCKLPALTNTAPHAKEFIFFGVVKTNPYFTSWAQLFN